MGRMDRNKTKQGTQNGEVRGAKLKISETAKTSLVYFKNH